MPISARVISWCSHTKDEPGPVLGKRRKSMIPHGKVESGSTNFKHTLQLWIARDQLFLLVISSLYDFQKISICPALLVYCHPIICHRHRQSSPQRHSTGKCVPHVCEETCFSQLLNCPFICELLQSNRILLKETWNPPSFLTQLEDIDML